MGDLLRSVISVSSLCRRRDVLALLANVPASQWDAWGCLVTASLHFHLMVTAP